MGIDDVGGPADGAAAESAARLRAIAERTTDVLYAVRLEPDLAVEYVSPASTDLIGATLEELYADPTALSRHLHPEDRELLTRLTGDPASYPGGVTVRWVLPDGSVRWSEHRSGTRRRDDGSLVLEGVARDVTQARADREALHRSAELFRLAVREAPIGMGLVGLDGRFVQVNDALCDFFHRDESELLTMSIEDLTESDDLAAEQRLLEGLLAGTRDSYRLRKRFLSPDGTRTHGDLQVSLLRDATGAPQFMLGQIVDVTDTVRALDALTDSEEQFRLLAENSSDLVVRTDVVGTVQWVSPSVRELLGHDPAALVGRPAIDLVYPDDRGLAERAPSPHSVADDPDGPATREIRCVTADGRPRWMAVRRRILRPDSCHFSAGCSSVGP